MRRFFYTQLVLLSAISFSLSSCDYSPESLPDTIVSDYELAIPIADTTFSFWSLAHLDQSPYLDDETIFVKDTEYSLPVQFPFYIADFTREGHIVDWIEPKAIVNNSFTDKIDIKVTYAVVSEGKNEYLLSGAETLSAGQNVLFGNAASRISSTQFEQFGNANKLKITFALKFKEDLLFKQIKDNKTHVKFGIKLKVKMTYTP